MVEIAKNINTKGLETEIHLVGEGFDNNMVDILYGPQRKTEVEKKES